MKVNHFPLCVFLAQTHWSHSLQLYLSRLTFDLSFGPMRGSLTPRRQPINRRQFSARGRGISQRLMSPLHVHFYQFLFYRSYLVPPTCSALLSPSVCVLPELSLPLFFYCLARISKFVCIRVQFKDFSAQAFLKQPKFLRTSRNICRNFLGERKLRKRPTNEQKPT